MEFALNGKKVHAFIEEGHSAGTSWNLNVGTFMKSWHYGRIYLSPDGSWSYHWNAKGLQELETYFIDVILAWHQ